MKTIEQIKMDEDYRSEIYLCTAGKRTWLWGRNIEDRPITDNEWQMLTDYLTKGKTFKEWAHKLLEIDIVVCISQLATFGYAPGEYPHEVGSVMINMLYNMGAGTFNPKKWPNFFTAIKDRDWKLVVAHGRDSLWYFQVGHRSKRLMKSLANVKED